MIRALVLWLANRSPRFRVWWARRHLRLVKARMRRAQERGR